MNIAAWEYFLPGVIKIRINEDEIKSNSSDAYYLKCLKEGELEDNLDKQYQMINALERGCGIQQRYKDIKDVLYEAFKTDPEKLGALLIARNRLYEFFFFLGISSTSMREHFLLVDGEKYLECFQKLKLPESNFLRSAALFYYECCRQQINEAERNQKKNITNKKALVNGIFQMSKYDKQLFTYWVRSNEYNCTWLSLLPELLIRVKSDIRMIWAETISMHLWVDGRQETGLGFNQKYYAAANSGVRAADLVKITSSIHEIQEILYNRWKEVLLQICENNSYYVSDSDVQFAEVHQGIILNVYHDYITIAIRQLFPESRMLLEEATSIMDLTLKGMEKKYYRAGLMAECLFRGLSCILPFLYLLSQKENIPSGAYALLEKVKWCIDKYELLWIRKGILENQFQELIRKIRESIEKHSAYCY